MTVLDTCLADRIDANLCKFCLCLRFTFELVQLMSRLFYSIDHPCVSQRHCLIYILWVSPSNVKINIIQAMGDQRYLVLL